MCEGVRWEMRPCVVDHVCTREEARVASCEVLTAYQLLMLMSVNFWEASLGISIFKDFCPLLAFDS